MAIGNTLFEKMQFGPDGQPLTTTPADYLLVSATEMPNIDLLRHEAPTPLNPLGVKGVGESGTLPTAAAPRLGDRGRAVAVRRAHRRAAGHVRPTSWKVIVTGRKLRDT